MGKGYNLTLRIWQIKYHPPLTSRAGTIFGRHKRVVVYWKSDCQSLLLHLDSSQNTTYPEVHLYDGRYFMVAVWWRYPKWKRKYIEKNVFDLIGFANHNEDYFKADLLLLRKAVPRCQQIWAFTPDLAWVLDSLNGMWAVLIRSVGSEVKRSDQSPVGLKPTIVGSLAATSKPNWKTNQVLKKSWRSWFWQQWNWTNPDLS